MTTKSKKLKVKRLCREMINTSHKAMQAKIEKVLESGAVNVADWDENLNPMILPKSIVTAILQDESTQYAGKGTTFEKYIKKEVSNIMCFI